eukprot:COSAG03_NODE_2040_length_3195_cov_14.095284_1_plen_55_part_00
MRYAGYGCGGAYSRLWAVEMRGVDDTKDPMKDLVRWHCLSAFACECCRGTAGSD